MIDYAETYIRPGIQVIDDLTYLLDEICSDSYFRKVAHPSRQVANDMKKSHQADRQSTKRLRRSHIWIRLSLLVTVLLPPSVVLYMLSDDFRSFAHKVTASNIIVDQTFWLIIVPLGFLLQLISLLYILYLFVISNWTLDELLELERIRPPNFIRVSIASLLYVWLLVASTVGAIFAIAYVFEIRPDTMDRVEDHAMNSRIHSELQAAGGLKECNLQLDNQTLQGGYMLYQNLPNPEAYKCAAWVQGVVSRRQRSNAFQRSPALVYGKLLANSVYNGKDDLNSAQKILIITPNFAYGDDTCWTSKYRVHHALPMIPDYEYLRESCTTTPRCDYSVCVFDRDTGSFDGYFEVPGHGGGTTIRKAVDEIYSRLHGSD